MLEKIAQIVGIRYNESDVVGMKVLQRIEARLPANTVPTHPAFAAMVRKAEEDVNSEGQLAIVALVKQITAPPPEKVMKIKSSPKGARIKIAATNGVRFSFGPVWNDSVSKCKGVALVETNRAKLNHQALMAGISNPESMNVKDLCTAIAATF